MHNIICCLKIIIK